MNKKLSERCHTERRQLPERQNSYRFQEDYLPEISSVTGNSAAICLCRESLSASLVPCMGNDVIQRGESPDKILEGLPDSTDMSVLDDVIEMNMGRMVAENEFGLVKVFLKEDRRIPGNLVAEYHVKAKGDRASTLTADIYAAFTFALANPNVQNFWMNPTGVQVVKMMVELLGETIGNRFYVEKAREKRQERQKKHKQISKKNAIDSTVVPEHELYLGSLYQTDGLVIRSNTFTDEGKFKNMLNDKAVFMAHKKALMELRESAASLNITFSRTIAERLVETLRKILQ